LTFDVFKFHPASMALFFLASPLWRRLGIAFVPSRLLWLPWLLLLVVAWEVVQRRRNGSKKISNEQT